MLNRFLCGLETVTRPFSETDVDMRPTVMPKEVMVEPRHFFYDPKNLKSAGGVRLFRLVELPDLCRRLFLSQLGRLRGAVAFARPRAVARGAVWSGPAAAKI